MNVTRFFFGFCCFQVMAEEKSRCWIMWHQQLFFRVGGGGVWNVKWIGLVSSWNNNLKEKDRACCTVWGLFTREQTRMWKQKGTRISTLKEVNDRLTLRKQSDQSFLYCPTVYVRWWVFLNHFLNDAAQSVAVATCVFDLTHACSFFLLISRSLFTIGERQKMDRIWMPCSVWETDLKPTILTCGRMVCFVIEFRERKSCNDNVRMPFFKMERGGGRSRWPNSWFYILFVWMTG